MNVIVETSPIEVTVVDNPNIIRVSSVGIQGAPGASSAQITGQLTGTFYPLNSNPASYVTTGQTGNFAANTGVLTGIFYPLNSNPSSYVTSSQTGAFGNVNIQVTGSTNLASADFTGIGGTVLSISGNYVLISGVNTGTLASSINLAATGAILQSEINTLNTWTGVSTGIFYTNSNPSGYISSVNSNIQSIIYAIALG